MAAWMSTLVAPREICVLNGDALLGDRKFILGMFLNFVSGRMTHAYRSLGDSPEWTRRQPDAERGLS
jgi:hypothetical protein